MAAHTLNLVRWLRQLGVKGGSTPEFLRSIQPVISAQVGAAKSIANMIGPRAWGGGLLTAPAGGGLTLIEVSPGPGGCIIHKCLVSSTGGGNSSLFQMELSVGPVDFTGGVVGTVSTFQMNPDEDAACTVRFAYVLNANLPPRTAIGDAFEWLLSDSRGGANTMPSANWDFYIPPGFVFTATSDAAQPGGSLLTCAYDIEDLAPTGPQ